MSQKDITYLPSSKEDILKLTAEELEISEELVLFTINKFFNTLRYFLKNPELTKRGIIISKYLKFYISKKTFYVLDKKVKDPEKIDYIKNLKKQIYGKGEINAGLNEQGNSSS